MVMAELPMVLFIANLFHPVCGLSVELFLNGDVRQTRRCRGSMPVFYPRRNPDNITLPNFFDWTAPLLNPAGASRHDQYLTERVGVPCRAGSRLKRNVGARRA